MNYVISDIHGCYNEYMALLEKLCLSEKDHLYVLGDAVDRGPAPVKVLQDLIGRKNVTFIMGNHDFLFWYFLGSRGLNLSNKDLSACDPDDIKDFQMWLEDGGITTAKQFIRLSRDERNVIDKWLENAGVYETVRDGAITRKEC